jgi:hypothetical protein
MINEFVEPGHFYSVIPNITNEYNNNETKFINLDFNEESHLQILEDLNSYLTDFDETFGISIDDNLLALKEEFLQYINFYNKQPKYSLFTFMENKNILIINNLGSIMKQQIENGNVKKIHIDFPDNVKSINYFENGYTFFNNGPDNNIM